MDIVVFGRETEGVTSGPSEGIFLGRRAWGRRTWPRSSLRSPRSLPPCRHVESVGAGDWWCSSASWKQQHGPGLVNGKRSVLRALWARSREPQRRLGADGVTRPLSSAPGPAESPTTIQVQGARASCPEAQSVGRGPPSPPPPARALASRTPPALLPLGEDVRARGGARTRSGDRSSVPR